MISVPLDRSQYDKSRSDQKKGCRRGPFFYAGQRNTSPAAALLTNIIKTVLFISVVLKLTGFTGVSAPS